MNLSPVVLLTGLLPFVVIVAAVLALPVCLILLRAYRRSVLKGMGEIGSGVISNGGPSPERGPRHNLLVHTPASLVAADLAAPDRDAYRQAVVGPWQTAAVYATAGGIYAALMTAGWLMATNDPAIVWIKVLVLFWTYLWPVVLSTLLVVAYDGKRRWQALGIYFALFLVMTAVAVARNPDLAKTDLLVFWALTNLPPSLLLLSFLARPIRAVGPLVLAFLLAVAIGSQALLSLASADERILRALANIGFAVGLDARGVFFGMIVAGMLLFAALGWPLLRWLGRRYERKAFSDQSLTMDSLWLLFAIVQSVGLAFEGSAWVLSGVVGFLAYKLSVSVGFRVARRQSSARKPRRLLLLRVFALGKRSEQLFDKVRKHWQQLGNISMIAGPDLVTSTVEPHEFLEFLSGRLGRQFVTGAEDLQRRLASMDVGPDPDGRYRVNEFFCRTDTWQMTMQRLAAISDAVLMDLRSFSPANQGCVFELGRLLDGVDLARIVFLVDQTTDRPFLEATLQRLWQQVGVDSPNQNALAPAARLFSILQQSEAELSGLLRLLLNEAAPASTAPT